MKNISYIRVSSKKQADEGHGLEVQTSKINDWCAYQKTGPATFFEDSAISGKSTDDRSGFLAAVATALENGENATLVVTKLDRLGRNAIDIQQVLEVLLDAGVRVVALDDGVDSAAGMGATVLKLLTSILATFAELERENIVARGHAGQLLAKETGQRYARDVAYGHASAPDPDHENAAITRARELHASGVSYRGIARQLTVDGFRPRKTTVWAHQTIIGMVTGVRKPRVAKRSSRLEAARQHYLVAPTISQK